MSDTIKHECGIAFLRLRKPIQYYIDKYGTPLYGLNKLYLLMEKQHNRGQDGAGIVSIKFDTPSGTEYINRIRSISNQPLRDIFKQLNNDVQPLMKNTKQWHDEHFVKSKSKYIGELLLGHLRYGTHGKNNVRLCHPFLRTNNWKARNLALAGNFNMTNSDELFKQLVALGQHPNEKSDTVTVLEKIGHFLDMEVQDVFNKFKDQGYSNQEISDFITNSLDIQRILQRSARDFDGGYVIAGLIGHGDAFVLRDPSGIRPAYYYYDDEVVVVCSERPCIQTAFNVLSKSIKEIDPGKALIVKKDGKISEEAILKPLPKRSCSFERIYFSRGTDQSIYKERKKLGYLLTPQILKAINYDLENTVFSFIPNTAEVAFLGMVKGVEDYINDYRLNKLKDKNNLEHDELVKLMDLHPRVEKIAVKDAKLRTFITEGASREELVSHVYDITYGTVRAGKDTLVILDDSIVRGTTLQKSILSILDRLEPVKIIVVSSAPQIRYPDCYGIDMSRMNEFIAFRATVELLHDQKKEFLMHEIYNKCKTQEKEGGNKVNFVRELYDQFSTEEISAKISEIVKPKHIFSEVEIIYQTIENLHKACPENLGDWYFTGKYPTPGGTKVACRSFINFVEGNNIRAYEMAY